MIINIDLIKELANLGADIPINDLFKSDDNYYDIKEVYYDESICEIMLVLDEDSVVKYSNRA